MDGSMNPSIIFPCVASESSLTCPSDEFSHPNDFLLSLPPNVTHFRFRDPAGDFNVDDLYYFDSTAFEFLTHVMIDCFQDTYGFMINPVLDALPSRCCCATFTFPASILLSDYSLTMLRDQQERHPQLLLVDTWGQENSVPKSLLSCDVSVASRLDVWDTVEELVARMQL